MGERAFIVTQSIKNCGQRTKDGHLIKKASKGFLTINLLTFQISRKMTAAFIIKICLIPRISCTRGLSSPTLPNMPDTRKQSAAAR